MMDSSARLIDPRRRRSTLTSPCRMSGAANRRSGATSPSRNG